jgi:uncharacterized cupin superfamily protein
VKTLAASAPHIHGAMVFDDLVDWGVQPDAVAGASRSSGRLLHKEPEGRPEAGLWVCTPGRWRISLPRDEFCHFTAGHAIYRSDAGEEIEVRAGTCVLFPEGWSGEAEVKDTIRNLYMLV